jgi:hypothetical protein
VPIATRRTSNLPASDPRSSVHKDNLAKTCGACHQNVNASFLTFDPHANPSDPKRNPYVYWIWLGMTSLLIGVFGFFGLHGLLWLQRALVGKLRGEFNFGHTSDGPYVRRFSSMQMGVHISIVVSFLLLGATGLPLKFPDAPWAPTLMSIFGGAASAGVLHRWAASSPSATLPGTWACWSGASSPRANAACSGARVRWCRNRATSWTSSA